VSAGESFITDAIKSGLLTRTGHVFGIVPAPGEIPIKSFVPDA